MISVCTCVGCSTEYFLNKLMHNVADVIATCIKSGTNRACALNTGHLSCAQVIHCDSVFSHVNQFGAHLILCAGASSEHKRRQVSSSYTERLRNLPSASQMSQIVMRQQQGCLHYNFHLQQPFLKSVTEPLYLKYRCEAKQVTTMPEDKHIWLLSVAIEKCGPPNHGLELLCRFPSSFCILSLTALLNCQKPWSQSQASCCWLRSCVHLRDTIMLERSTTSQY